MGSQRISPTAHYTGYVWARNGLGDPGLVTREGRLLYAAAQSLIWPVGRLGGPTLEHFLLARHRILDRLLTERVEAGSVTQVVELAAGLSPRGLTFVRRHPDLRYVEVDLPGMVERKRAALDRTGTDPARHSVVAADVFGAELDEVFAGLDDAAGIAVVTEGLLNYFPGDDVARLWRRVADALRPFPSGVYLSDLHLVPSGRASDRAFAAALGLVVRGRVHFHFADEDAALQALATAGFATARLHAPVEHDPALPGMRAAGAGRVRVVEAGTAA